MEEADNHSKECALIGHCIENGYGIVSKDDHLTLLDAEATRKVVDVVEQSDTRQGIHRQVTHDE